MFYRLKPEYALRGWEKFSCALVRRPDNAVKALSREVFQALLLCDGETELSEERLDKRLSAALSQCEKEGWTERRRTPDPIGADQAYRYYKNRYVDHVFWSVTGRCNFRCRHCFMDAPEGALGELSTKEALALIDEMAACGVLRVNLTGGEPLVRRDFWQLVDRIRSHGMVIGKIYTNGWLLKESVLDELESRGMRPGISMSFDGVGWHDWMRGVEGAEEAALRALALCRDRGLKTDAELCIHRGNQDCLPQTIAALGRAGVTHVKASNVAMTKLWRQNSEGNALTDEEYLEAMIRYIPEYFKAGCPMDLVLANAIVLKRDGSWHVIAEFYDGTESCLDCHLCSNARMSCYVTPEGRLLPCMPMTSSPQQERFPLIREIGLSRGLSDSFYMDFVGRRVRDLLAANAECAACKYRYRCGGGCRATALLYGSHDLMGCDRIMCLLWKKGYAERIRQAAGEAAAKYAAPRAKNAGRT